MTKRDSSPTYDTWWFSLTATAQALALTLVSADPMRLVSEFSLHTWTIRSYTHRPSTDGTDAAKGPYQQFGHVFIERQAGGRHSEALLTTPTGSTTETSKSSDALNLIDAKLITLCLNTTVISRITQLEGVQLTSIQTDGEYNGSPPF